MDVKRQLAKCAQGEVCACVPCAREQSAWQEGQEWPTVGVALQTVEGMSEREMSEGEC